MRCRRRMVNAMRRRLGTHRRDLNTADLKGGHNGERCRGLGKRVERTMVACPSLTISWNLTVGGLDASTAKEVSTGAGRAGGRYGLVAT